LLATPSARHRPGYPARRARWIAPSTRRHPNNDEFAGIHDRIDLLFGDIAAYSEMSREKTADQTVRNRPGGSRRNRRREIRGAGAGNNPANSSHRDIVQRITDRTDDQARPPTLPSRVRSGHRDRTGRGRHRVAERRQGCGSAADVLLTAPVPAAADFFAYEFLVAPVAIAACTGQAGAVPVPSAAHR